MGPRLLQNRNIVLWVIGLLPGIAFWLVVVLLVVSYVSRFAFWGILAYPLSMSFAFGIFVTFYAVTLLAAPVQSKVLSASRSVVQDGVGQHQHLGMFISFGTIWTIGFITFQCTTRIPGQIC